MAFVNQAYEQTCDILTPVKLPDQLFVDQSGSAVQLPLRQLRESKLRSHDSESACAYRISGCVIYGRGDARLSTITPPRSERAVQPAGLEVVDAWIRDRGCGIAAAAVVAIV
jgi:hypothetical protein